MLDTAGESARSELRTVRGVQQEFADGLNERIPAAGRTSDWSGWDCQRERGGRHNECGELTPVESRREGDGWLEMWGLREVPLKIEELEMYKH